MLGGGRVLAEEVGGVGPPGGEPLGRVRLQHRGQLGVPVERAAGVGVAAEVVLEGGELRRDQPALQALGRLGQEVERLAVAAEAQQQVGGRLDAGAEPRVEFERPAGGGEGVLDPVGQLVGARPLDARPRAAGGDRHGQNVYRYACS